MKYLPILLFFLTALSSAESEYSQTFDNYTVDYSIFPSTFLSPSIAGNYGLKRSKYENLINVFVSEAGKKGGVKMKLSAHIKNLMGQQQNLLFQEIAEDNTVYYLAPIKIRGEEHFHFEITCTVVATQEKFVVKFSKKLYQEI